MKLVKIDHPRRIDQVIDDFGESRPDPWGPPRLASGRRRTAERGGVTARGRGEAGQG
jgi:hypothetical protein